MNMFLLVILAAIMIITFGIAACIACFGYYALMGDLIAFHRKIRKARQSWDK
jgi:hypothetical protein